jgi:hypothetical protein
MATHTAFILAWLRFSAGQWVRPPISLTLSPKCSSQGGPCRASSRCAHATIAPPSCSMGRRPRYHRARRVVMMRLMDETAAMNAEAVIPSTRSRKSPFHTTRRSTSYATASSAASTSSSTSVASPLDMTGGQTTSSPSSTSPQSVSGSSECGFVLARLSEIPESVSVRPNQ